MNAFGFTERQAEAIVTLQLYRLTNTDIVSLENEQKELQALIESLNAILNSEKVLRKVIINELNEVKKNIQHLVSLKSKMKSWIHPSISRQ